MCECLNPDERLFKYNNLKALDKFIQDNTEYYENTVTPVLGWRKLCGAMLYGVDAVYKKTHSPVKWRYGIELEFEFHRCYADKEQGELENLQIKLAKVVNILLVDKLKHFSAGGGGVVEDHSLDRGWEVILPAMSPAKIVETMSPVMSNEFIKPYLRHGGNAALHVTVDPFDTPEQQRAFHNFWNDTEFYDDFFNVTHRWGNGYTKRRVVSHRGKALPADTRKTHYNRCNVRKNGAMEVRVFQAVYEDAVLYRQIMLVHWVNKAVRKGELSYGRIKKFLKTRGF